MLDLLDVEEGSIHGVVFDEERFDQVLHLLEELVIAHDLHDLLIVRLVQAAVVLVVVRCGLAHELVRLELHFFGYLRNDGTLAEAALIDFCHWWEIESGPVLHSLAAGGEGLRRQDHTFLDLNILIQSSSSFNHAVLVNYDAI